VVAKVDTVMDVRGNCIRQPVQIAKRNVKFLSSQAVIVRSTAKIAIPKGKQAVVDLTLCSDLLRYLKARQD
jgi:hypothetical protein